MRKVNVDILLVSKVNANVLYYAAMHLAKTLCGRVSTLRAHVRECPYVNIDAKGRLEEEDRLREGPREGSAETTASAADHVVHPTSTITYHPKTKPTSLTYTETQEFHLDILHLFAANNFPLHAIDSAQTHVFAEKWLPGLVLPTRQALGGRILKSAVKESKENMRKATDGKLAIGISDGWKNISRKSLLAYMVNVEYKVSQYTLFVVEYA